MECEIAKNIWIGAVLLTTNLLGIVVITWLADQTMLFRQVPLGESPRALSDRARAVIKHLGANDSPRDSVYLFYRDDDYLSYVTQHDPSTTRWTGLTAGQPAAMYFFYRQSPQPLVPASFAWPPGFVAPHDPQPSLPGMVSVSLDLKGRLLAFRAV